MLREIAARKATASSVWVMKLNEEGTHVVWEQEKPAAKRAGASGRRPHPALPRLPGRHPPPGPRRWDALALLVPARAAAQRVPRSAAGGGEGG